VQAMVVAGTTLGTPYAGIRVLVGSTNYSVPQQANGAIAMVDVLLTEIDRKEPENQDEL
jgi:hypothetical protein